MMEEYERLQDERNKILEERQMLYERMHKIEQLQQLQKRYHEELKRIKAETEGNRQNEEEQAEEQQN